ncbi:hypothetical protein BJ508DRAFT_139710 [Ascobolus immersus RN42]|uniref:Uncharacterized protein n=1 Tax=Ascobolus immersus RN42 TaxID=1160509 RepID=A0A3N4I628_ASCIM|nr:hypothetical protein BJ508DRAFT_139710 [Ascobolus immersus RN42]
MHDDAFPGRLAFSGLTLSLVGLGVDVELIRRRQARVPSLKPFFEASLRSWRSLGDSRRPFHCDLNSCRLDKLLPSSLKPRRILPTLRLPSSPPPPAIKGI